MTITLEQFKKFANENDILWFYNKPRWRQEEMYLDESFKDALPYIKFKDGEIIEIDIKMEKTPFIDRLVKMQDDINLHNQKTKEGKMKVNLEIAKICHKVNRDYCIDEQLVAPPKWDELPLKIQESIISGVELVIANPKITPTEIHQKWCDYKAEEGWKPGEVKDFKLKIHPNLVEFKDLPSLEKRKDVIFIRTVKREMKK